MMQDATTEECLDCALCKTPRRGPEACLPCTVPHPLPLILGTVTPADTDSIRGAQIWRCVFILVARYLRASLAVHVGGQTAEVRGGRGSDSA
jgi:hypothetical protein